MRKSKSECDSCFDDLCSVALTTFAAGWLEVKLWRSTFISQPISQPSLSSLLPVPACSPARGGDVTVYVCDINQLSLPTPFCSVLVSISACMALSTVFHSLNSPDNSPFSDSVLLVLSWPYWSFQLCIMKVSFSPDIVPSGWLGSNAN